MSAIVTNPNLVDGIDNLTPRRPNIASFKPSPWTERFMDYTPDVKAIEALQKQAKELKEELDKEMLSFGDKPLMEQLCFIDIIERLGVAYHFDKEIEDALQRIHEMTDSTTNTLFLTSLRFRLLRQHGFNASSDVFKGFVSSDGSLKEEVSNDIEGILSLYEACHSRGHEDEILDEALPFVVSILKSIQDQSRHPLKEQVSHALHKPLHKWPTCLESLHHMQVYKRDPSHHKTLLHFSKVDFNLLQSAHKEEISDLCRWWIGKGVASKLPIKDRIVESYLVASVIYCEPQYSIGRKILTTAIQTLTSLDDFYDAYGLPQEVEIFTQAIQRWEKCCLDELPENLRLLYRLVVDVVDEIEMDLAAKGRSHYISYAREEMKSLCEAYLTEASWRNKDYVPTLDEYMDFVHRNTGYVATMVFTFLIMDMASHGEFEWVRELSKPVKSVSLLLRIMDDIGSGEVDKNRGHSAMAIECHMKHYGVSYEQACKELYEKTKELWKDINQAMISPREVPFPLLKRIHTMAHVVQVIYDGGEDGFTSINPVVTNCITSLFIDPITIDQD